MSWEIETSDEFVSWYESLTEDEIDSVDFSIRATGAGWSGPG
jgi:hypothetical protein